MGLSYPAIRQRAGDKGRPRIRQRVVARAARGLTEGARVADSETMVVVE
jgi:hypothetical protein